jgi:predicted transcriptional regulator
MAKDPISDAESRIRKRGNARESTSRKQRSYIAAESIADEMTRLVAEMSAIRALLVALVQNQKYP